MISPEFLVEQHRLFEGNFQAMIFRTDNFSSIRILFLLFVSLASVVPGSALAQDSFVVTDMRVEGLQRISEGTVFTYLPINIGDTIDQSRVQESIRALYSQALFDDVEIRRDEQTLVIVVEERPSIENFTIDGNKDIKTEDLMESLRNVGLARGKTFDRSVLDNVQQFLVEQYYDRGKYAVEVETDVEERPNNTVAISIDASMKRKFAPTSSWIPGTGYRGSARMTDTPKRRSVVTLKNFVPIIWIEVMQIFALNPRRLLYPRTAKISTSRSAFMKVKNIRFPKSNWLVKWYCPNRSCGRWCLPSRDRYLIFSY
jgi:outer membrane protein assembly factor BamA